MPDNQINSGQEQAIHHGSGPMLVSAGPGSGKTYTITQRLLYLIEEKRVEPDSILVITFTKEAASEMKNRFHKLTQGRNYPVSFGTFHAVFYHILKITYHYRSGNILSDTEKKEILRTILIQLKTPYPENDELDGILSQISRYKNEETISMTNQASLRYPDFERILNAYQAETEKRRKLDFDDMVLNCKRLFQEYPQILQEWQKKFRYILIDEFQDINQMQYDVIRMLALPENNIFAVGDDDQSIYSFRGAKPEIMSRFLSDYMDCKKTELSVNYRSRKEIVEAADCMISKNRNRIEKHMTSGRGEGGQIRFWGFASNDKENEHIADAAVQDWKAGNATAIITRTNQEAGMFAEIFCRKKLPCSIREKYSSPFADPVCQDILAYLSFVFNGQSRTDFFRIMNRPSRYIGRNALCGEKIEIDKLKRFYQNQSYMLPGLRKLEFDLERLKKMDLYAAVNYIRKGMGYDQWLKANNMDGIRKAEWFQKQVREFSGFLQLMDYIGEVEKEMRMKTVQNGKEGVQLLTMHASKGLEFDSVYIPGCNEGYIPHKKSIHPSQIEEERRMLYVAVTRAREKLTLSWIAGTKEEPGRLSRFLNDFSMKEHQFSPSISSSNSQLSRYSSKASATASYSSSSSI